MLPGIMMENDVNIDRVTMTGADDSVSPRRLLPISLKHPSTEWGILFSKSQEGGPRFPSSHWVLEFGRIAVENNLSCCAHICGRWVREMVEDGRYSWFADRAELLTMFQRVQINFHASKHRLHPDFFKLLADNGDKQFIFQMDDVNNPVLERCLEMGLNAVPLFDTSGGAGIVPAAWPKPIEGVYCGYAGGLGPDSVLDELRRIKETVGDLTIWIDMETRIRSDDDRTFDLTKVDQCLGIVSGYLQKAA
jgi:hypothetical protein